MPDNGQCMIELGRNYTSGSPMQQRLARNRSLQRELQRKMVLKPPLQAAYGNDNGFSNAGWSSILPKFRLWPGVNSNVQVHSLLTFRPADYF